MFSWMISEDNGACWWGDNQCYATAAQALQACLGAVQALPAWQLPDVCFRLEVNQRVIATSMRPFNNAQWLGVSHE